MRPLLPMALGALVALIGVGAAQEETQDPAELVAAVLGELEIHGDRAVAADALKALGPEAVPPMFDVMVTGRGLPQLAVTDALSEAPVDAVAAAITAAIEASPPPGPSPDLQSASLVALKSVATSAEFDLCLLAARVLGDETYAPRTRELTEALDAIFERDDRLLGVIERSWLGIEQRLRTPVARSVANRGGDGALHFLIGLLERDEGSAGMLLSQLGRVAHGSVSREAADDAADVAREFLGHEAQGVVKETAVLLARLDDDDAVPMLIPLLAEEGRGLTGNVHWSLQEITGLSLPLDEASWSAWHERESEWWSRESGKVFARLRHRDAVVAGDAVREVASHRLAHHALASELLIALEHRVASVREDAVEALVRIGSDVAVPALERALEDRDAGVVASARAALVELTGHDPLADPEVAATAVVAAVQ